MPEWLQHMVVWAIVAGCVVVMLREARRAFAGRGAGCGCATCPASTAAVNTPSPPPATFVPLNDLQLIARRLNQPGT